MKPAADDFDFISRRLKELRPAEERVSQREWQGQKAAPSALADLCLASEDGDHWFDICGRCNHCGEFRT